MRIPRVYLPNVVPGQQKNWQLERETRHYLINVLRLKPGRELVVFDGQNEWESRATLLAANKQSAEIKLLETYPTHRESPLQIRLCLGISKPDHMDFAIQKAVELGVREIQPVFCERAALRPDDPKLEKKIAHWDSIIASACEQSGRCIKPTLSDPRNYNDVLTSSAERLGIILMPDAEAGFSQLTPPENNHITVFIGPEGGFSEEESCMATAQGIRSVVFGPRILRTETAVVATLTGLQLRFGDLEHGSVD